MILFVVRFISLLFLALATGVVFSHVLQAHHKTTLPGPVYLTVQTVLYSDYGKVGGILEAGAFLASLMTLIFIWGRPAPFGLTLIAALCVAAMTVVWGPSSTPLTNRCCIGHRSRSRVTGPSCGTDGRRCMQRVSSWPPLGSVR